MASDGKGYWPDGYFAIGYWHKDYWYGPEDGKVSKRPSMAGRMMPRKPDVPSMDRER